MTSGPTSSLARNSFMRAHCLGSTLGARHMRGLAEKICKVLAPISRARSTALDAPRVVRRWMPMRLVMVLVYSMMRRRLGCMDSHPFRTKRGKDGARSLCGRESSALIIIVHDGFLVVDFQHGGDGFVAHGVFPQNHVQLIGGG